VAPAIKPLWISPAIVAAFNLGKPCADSRLAAVDYQEPSLVFLAGTGTRLTDVKGAAALLAEPGGCGVAVLPATMRGDLQTRLAAGARLEDIGAVEGFSYSNGADKQLVLVRLAP
jgi:hypothetical protein